MAFVACHQNGCLLSKNTLVFLHPQDACMSFDAEVSWMLRRGKRKNAAAQHQNNLLHGGPVRRLLFHAQQCYLDAP